ncbi:uncharacterized protein Tco_0474750 [Tanacetum coccineum]
MERVLENGPWLIRLVLLILNVWTPNSKLKKDDITYVPIWVKMHNVPIVAYSEIGLSLITSTLGKPIMLDGYTSNMCINSWGRNSYARALIEVSAKTTLLDSIVVAIPLPNGMGHSMETIDIEYEWQPPRCETCKIFDHNDNQCPKKVVVTNSEEKLDDGFVEVKRKGGKGKTNTHSKQIHGIRLNKPMPSYKYRPVNKSTNEKGEAHSVREKEQIPSTNGSQPNEHTNAPSQLADPRGKKASIEDDFSFVSVRNSFQSLTEDDKMIDANDRFWSISSVYGNVEEDDSEEVEEMFSVAAWNIRGMNQTPKQNEVRQVISENNLCVCAILESHVTSSRLDKLCLRVFKHWTWTSNGVMCVKDSRIILGWNPDIVDIVIISSSDQVMHTGIYFKADKKEMFCSFVYTHNRYQHRRELWNNLIIHKAYVRNRPWCLMGDFNASLHIDDKSVGSSYVDTAMRNFQDCVAEVEVTDINSSGLRFTWNQKPRGTDGLLKKIDRIMANLEFNMSFVGSSALFQPYRISDHSPAILRIPTTSVLKPRPFKFSNVVVHKTRFKEIVSTGWQFPVSGFWMYKVVKKLKMLKKPLRKLLYDQGNIIEKVKRLRHELDEVQRALDSDPFNVDIREEEAVYIRAFQDALFDEELFLKQKAKVKWLKSGDANSAYFHKVVKSRASKNRIDSVTTTNGVRMDGDSVPMAFIDHYTSFLAVSSLASSTRSRFHPTFNVDIREEEAVYIRAFQDALLDEERFLKQKAKVEWLKSGDANSAYFHNVPMAFIDHYTSFLGQQGVTYPFIFNDLFRTKLSTDAADFMVRDVSDQDIRDAIFSLGDDKSPGPDGYTAAFFKEAWDIIAQDVCNAVKEFFVNGVLLKELNHTIIALIPKVATPLKINDYRPISCCNVLFKCISKIISNRINDSLMDLVSLNQSAFVPGRRISDNILLTQELMHNYHLDRGPPRCAFKVDFQKAYDTVDWVFLKEVLVGFGFHPRMIGWIMECVSSTSFSISINGYLHGYFKGKRGLRQGDPVSPYHFTPVMEVLTLMLHRRVSLSESFTYHRYCSDLNIINLCFADDAEGVYFFAIGDLANSCLCLSWNHWRNSKLCFRVDPEST